MNNLFLEGPIQTGKSTLIRELLKARKDVGGFTVQRLSFPTKGEEKRTGFRLMAADAPIKAHTCVTATDDNLIASDGVFKLVGPKGSKVNLEVFETKGVELLKQALKDAKAGKIKLVLLDEIGGHELACKKFCKALDELLDSDIPCVGVIKQYKDAKKMDASIAEANKELHKKITGPKGEHGEILYYERGDEKVRNALNHFINGSSGGGFF